MKQIFLFLIIHLVFINLGLAEDCPPTPSLRELDNWSAQGLNTACMIQRKTYKCQELQFKHTEEKRSELKSEFESSDIVKNLSAHREVAEIGQRFVSCDEKTIAQSTKILGKDGCVYNGLKLTVNNLKALPEAVIGFFKDTENCYLNVDKKREMVTTFNLGVSEKFQMKPEVVDQWTCGEVEKQLSSRLASYRDYEYRQHIQNRNLGKGALQFGDANAASEFRKDMASGIAGLENFISQSIDSMASDYYCLTPQYQFELRCAMVVNYIGELAMGAAGGLALSGMGVLLKSKSALSRIQKALLNGEKISLKDASLLSDTDRLSAAQAALKLKRPLTDSEKSAIIKAHEIGISEGRGFGTYTQADIIAKTRILKEAGFTSDQIRQFMDSGITGQFPLESASMKSLLSDKTTDAKSLVVKAQGLMKEASGDPAKILKAKSAFKEAGDTFAEIALKTKNPTDAARALENLVKSGDSEALTRFIKKSESELGISREQSLSEINKRLQISAQGKDVQSNINSRTLKETMASLEKMPTASTPTSSVVVSTQPVSPAPVTVPSPTVITSSGRSEVGQKVIDSFKNDKLFQHQDRPIPSNLSAEDSFTAQSRRKAEARKILDSLPEMRGNQNNPVGFLQEEAEHTKRVFYRVQTLTSSLANPDLKLTKSQINDLKLDLEKAKASLEVYQTRCRNFASLYQAADYNSDYAAKMDELVKKLCD